MGVPRSWASSGTRPVVDVMEEMCMCEGDEKGCREKGLDAHLSVWEGLEQWERHGVGRLQEHALLLM